jgi:transcriptional regulator with XRE-family HTH domain
VYSEVRTIASVDVAARFGQNLSRCRQRAQISQEELGRRADLHRTEISLLERGTRIARVDTLVKLAGALAVPPVDLIEGIAWTPVTTSGGGFDVEAGEEPPRAQAALVSPTRSA